MHRNRFARSALAVGAGVLALVLGTTGLALAGANVPDAAREAFERAGISLPNQADGGGAERGDRARSHEVKTVIETTVPADRGCEFGHSVAEAARGASLPETAQAACTRSDTPAAPTSAGQPKANTGSGNSAGRQFGQDTSQRARGLGDATVGQRRQFGRDTAERAKQLGNGSAPDRTTAPPASTPAVPPVNTPASGHPTGPPSAAPGGPPAGRPGGRP